MVALQAGQNWRYAQRQASGFSPGATTASVVTSPRCLVGVGCICKGALAARIKPLRNQLLNVYFLSKIFSKVGDITFKFYVILTL
ncbi:hypothetical protein [Scytonema sp. PRP1]|uniref:hypothetical protein n=1 Tax=Scytonema sp. PRP1 TaxID=3120513 RepID=UPI002FD2E24A